MPTVLAFVPVAAAWIGWRGRERGGRRAAIWVGLFLLGCCPDDCAGIPA